MDRTSPLIPFKQIPGLYRRLAGTPKNPSHASVRRWYQTGTRSGIRLNVEYRSGSVFTTRENVELFIRQRDAQSKQKHIRRSFVHLEKSSPDLAMARLSAMGI